MQAVLERLRSRAFEALVLAFALGSVVEAFAAPHAHPHALVALLALGGSLPFLWRPRHKFWAPLAVCADVALLADTEGLPSHAAAARSLAPEQR